MPTFIPSPPRFRPPRASEVVCGFYNHCIGLVVLVLGIFSMTSLHAQQERIVWRMDSKAGAISLQLQNVRDGIKELSVDVIDIRTRKLVDTLTAGDFEKTDLKHVFKATWKPKAKAGLFAMIVKKKSKGSADDAGSSQASEPDGVSSHTPYGKVKFDGEYRSVRGSLDFGKKRFVWKLNKPAVMRCLVMMESGLPIARIMDWRLAPVGEGSVAWDFVGNDGLPYFQHPDLLAQIQTVPIPSHWIVWGEIDWEEVKGLPEFSGLDLPQHQLGFSLKALGKGAEDVEGIWRINFSPGAGLRLELDEATRTLLVGKRFEILLYINGQFLHEESLGVSPYTYALPANLKGQGVQYLTVNVVDYRGQWGTRTILLDFGKGEAGQDETGRQ